MIQEEKAKAYDEVLEKAKNLYVDSQIDFKKNLETLFPELKESEDERIKNEIIKFLELPHPQFVGKRHQKEWIAWLEKQGEQKSKNESTDTCDSLIIKSKEFPASEKRDFGYFSEPADKLEPKLFHEGDWIISDTVDKDYHICKIIGVKDGNYTIESTCGYKGYNQFDVFNNAYRLWTIQDAKDGDVLYSIDSNRPFIYKERKLNEQAIAYCGLNIYGKFFVWGTKDCVITLSNYVPATKEQRDLLFQKMKESGYEWMEETRELKKIDDEEVNGEDYGIDSLYHAQRILEKTLGNVEGYQSDDGILDHKAAITAVKKLYKRKPTDLEEFINELSKQFPDVSFAKLSRIAVRVAKWAKPTDEEMKELLRTEYEKGRADAIAEIQNPARSEEDEHKVKDIIYFLDTAKKHYASTVELDACIDWLKSLKDRCTWKPTEEQMDALLFVVQHYTPKVTDKLAWDSIKILELMYYEIK